MTRMTLALVLLLVWAAAVARAGSGASPAATAPSIRDSPGYLPLHDPDSLDEVLGRRRNAPRVKMEFEGGARSLDDLGRAICRALHSAVPDSMLALCVRSEEFRVILWPEFPQSRPATGLRWDDAWQIVWGHLNGGSVGSVREYQDHYHEFIRIEAGPVAAYRNFRLHNKVTITAKSDEGRIETFTFVRSIAERRGRYKIFSLRD
jgi:hypothetical protein